MRCLPLVVLPLVLGLAACDEDPAGSADPFFATNPEPGGEWNFARFDGKLVVRDRCVLIGGPDEYSLPIWRHDFTAERDDAGHLVVRDDEGVVVAIEGKAFAMGGGYVAEFQPPDRVEPRSTQVGRIEDGLGHSIPDRCLGDDVYGIWSVGQTTAL